MPNDLTTRGYPLPHPDNVAREDAQRIRDALSAISDDIEQMTTEPPVASETDVGNVRLATAAEATGGTATDAVPVVKRVKDMITSVTNALHTSIAGEYNTAITSAINALKGGVDPAYDTLVEIAAKLTDMTQINAILDSLAKRLRIDTAAQGLDATQQSNGRTNLGLGDVATKNVATAAQIRQGNSSVALTADQAWAAAGFVDLGNSGSGTLNIDCNSGVRFRVVLTGNVTVNFLNPKDGQNVDVTFVQDGSGGRTVSWNSNVRFPNGTTPTVATAAGGWALIFTGVYNSNYGQWLGAGWKLS
ncbi:hypothetical protein [Bradyrhizobium yuanmingense]|uniref:hypothetical protein n=1 Tax=Bradyrhizobium yuanmingense TaxID=108015 RepID=UPI0035123ABB